MESSSSFVSQFVNSNDCNGLNFVVLLLYLLAPAYTLLAVAVLLSRHVKFLGKLASHGKTRKTTNATTTLTSTATATAATGCCMTWNNKFGYYCWVSKQYFVHFYIVGLASNVAVFVYLQNNSYASSTGRRENGGKLPTLSAVAHALLLVHLVRRCYESQFIQKPSKMSKMHILGYLLGIGHYMVLPLVFFSFECTDLSTTSHEAWRLNMSWRLLLWSIAIFNLILQREQYEHHCILASLRRQKEKSSMSVLYSVPPKERWFSRILCPHYLAEILIYATWTLLLELGRRGQSTSSGTNDNIIIMAAQRRHWFLLLWVATNLAVSSRNNLDWYRSKYPNASLGNRTALIPGLF